MLTGDIFIVDDNPNNLNLLAGILRDHGYGVRMANSGRRAVSTVRSHPPELVMLDIRMPEMDGYEVCEALKADPATSSIPIVFISALDDPFDKVRAFKSGGCDYVTKPFQEQEVVARVENQLRISRLQRELERRNAELARKNQELLELNEEKNRFVGMAAHDLRHPITVTKAYLGLFVGGILGEVPENQLQIMKTMDGACESMLALIDDLLDVSAIEAGHLDLHTVDVDIVRFLEECLADGLLVAKAKSIEMRLDVPPAMPMVRMDPKRIRQVVNNLVSNAVKFSHSGTSVCLGARPDGGDIHMFVRDQGQGIPEGELQKVFAEFVRLSVKPTGGERSTGLGLAIVKRIVEAHGGRIWVDSEANKGSTFTFALPFRGAADA